MSAVFELAENSELFIREQKRFGAALENIEKNVQSTNRIAKRYAAAPEPSAESFVNTPDTDRAIESNREWAAGIFENAENSELGKQAVADSVIVASEVPGLVRDCRKAASNWATLRGAAKRAKILEECGKALESRRAEFLEIMALEAGKTIEQGDPEVSEAVDFAYY